MLAKTLIPTSLNICIMMLGRVSSVQAEVSDQYWFTLVACLGLLTISEPLLWATTVIYCLPTISNRIKSKRFIPVETIQITGMTMLLAVYTTYTGRYVNPAQSFGPSENLNHVFTLLGHKWSIFIKPNGFGDIKRLIMLQFRTRVSAV